MPRISQPSTALGDDNIWIRTSLDAHQDTAGDFLTSF
jgi:hypothetical protein